MKKNYTLQILRAIAALLVVYTHSFNIVASHQKSCLSGFRPLGKFGACGVDIFFAISGFILSSVILHKKPETTRQAADFITRRFIRIFPIYWILSLFSLAFAVRHQLLSVSWIMSSYLLLPTFHYPLQAPLLYTAWTLLFEMFFYYALSFNLLFSQKAVIPRTILFICALVGIGSVFGFQHPFLILIANPMNIEFVFGCCIALIYAKLGKQPALGTVLIVLGAAVLTMTIIFGFRSADNANLVLNGQVSWYRVLHWGLPAGILTAGFIFSHGEIRSAFGKLWVYLGDASYSIYLTSVITLYFYNRFYRFLTHIPANLNLLLALIVVSAIGAACYSWVERPITQIISMKYQQSKARASFHTVA
jgi:exopolysaccharide production protein ExoZ